MTRGNCLALVSDIISFQTPPRPQFWESQVLRQRHLALGTILQDSVREAVIYVLAEFVR